LHRQPNLKALFWISLWTDIHQEGAPVKTHSLAQWLLVYSILLCFANRPALAGEPAIVGPPACEGIVFVANGAGDLRGTSEGFAAAVAEAGLPWEVRTFKWSHVPPGTGFLDLKDRRNHRKQGEALAAEVLAQRTAHPGCKIILVGHSAGCAVVVEATSHLPPDSVDNMVLLAAAISSHYDLKPALTCVHCGIDVFYSRKDCYLWALQSVGPPDCIWACFGGRSGFQLRTDVAADPTFAGRLRQHPWHTDVSWTGHDGGHFGYDKKDYLRYYVFPALLRSEQGPMPK
jgi:pimeloyl-ACP methyl ester carboxylesterase